MKATTTETPIICESCGADEMGCTVKAGLSGRRCCPDCTHGVGRGESLAQARAKESTVSAPNSHDLRSVNFRLNSNLEGTT